MKDSNCLTVDKHYSDGLSTRYFIGYLTIDQKIHYCVQQQSACFSKIILQGETSSERFGRFLNSINDNPNYQMNDLTDKLNKLDRFYKL